MLAAVLEDFDELVVKDAPRPEPERDEVVVRIESCGFCATDYKAIKGIRRNVEFPAIVGHEPAGVVAAAGPHCRHFVEGDEVIVQPAGYCGFCEHCREGRTHYCREAFTTGGDGPDDVWPGAFAEYMLTREHTLFHKPGCLSFDEAALTEPLAGAWKGVVQYSRIQVGEDVVIIGVGGIGMLCLLVAQAAGAGRLVAVDVSDYALEKARELGATAGVNPQRVDVREAVWDVMPNGPDLIVEAAGPVEAVETMMSLRRRGTRVNLFGITTHEAFSLDGGETHFLETRMDASFGITPTAMSRAIRLMERGLVEVEQVISHRFPLKEIHEAVEVMGSPEHNIVIVNP
ncbi:MAG: alcohol dehydrogenase catalytic domain-containing protein [Candidatus Brocadiia bacterium]